MLTSGGTESILISLLAHREEARARGIAEPEVVSSSTAHGAVAKAGFYFGMKVVLVHPDPTTMRLTRAAVESVCSPATCCIFASAPSFPHGVVDDLRGLGALALELGCGLHMDNCLGGVLLQHLHQEGKLEAGGHAATAAQLGLQLPGLTAMSMDVHKYGYASKGASVVLFTDPALRRRSFKPVGPVPGGAYSGGPYITATLQGARGGGAIAAAWATVAAMGNTQYRAAACRLHNAFVTVRAAVEQTPGVELVGDPELAVVAMRPCGSPSAEGQVGVTAFAEGMKERGWAVFSGLNPFAASLCLGEQHVRAAGKFADDLKGALAEAHEVAAAAEADKASRSSSSSRRGEAGGEGAVAGPYQSGGVLNEAMLNQMLIAYVENGLDNPVDGIPSAKL